MACVDGFVALAGKAVCVRIASEAADSWPLTDRGRRVNATVPFFARRAKAAGRCLPNLISTPTV
jgi:hypothetical protein